MLGALFQYLERQTRSSYLPPQRQIRVVKGIAWGTLVIILLGVLATLFFASDGSARLLLGVTGGVLVVINVATLVLLRFGHVASATALISVAVFLGTTIMVLPYGVGNSNLIMLGFVIPLVLLGQLWGRFGVAVAFSLAIMSLTVLILFGPQSAPPLPGQQPKEPLVDVGLTLSMLMLTAQIVVGARTEIVALTNTLQQTINRLNQALDQIEAMTIAQERDRMAKEIHDGLGSHLHTINLYASILRDNPNNGLREKAITVIQNEIVEAQSELRKTINDLRDRYQDRPEDALEDLISVLVRDSQFHGIDTLFHISGTPQPLPEKVKHGLYRITQEGLTNIYKHAQADHARICVDYTDPHQLTLSISDDGVGMLSPRSGGQGLQNIRDRVTMLEGQLTITSQKGVTLWIRIPRSGF